MSKKTKGIIAGAVVVVIVVGAFAWGVFGGSNGVNNTNAAVDAGNQVTKTIDKLSQDAGTPAAAADVTKLNTQIATLQSKTKKFTGTVKTDADAVVTQAKEIAATATTLSQTSQDDPNYNNLVDKINSEGDAYNKAIDKFNNAS